MCRDPNIILITIDSLRADHLGCYGYKRNTSPIIDELAKNGVLFNQAIAQSSHTAPSLTTILTSTLPHTHLLLEWGYSLNHKLSTISEVLKFRGYRTMFIGSDIIKLNGFNKGFDLFCVSNIDSHIITNEIVKFFREDVGKPFFIWVHYFDTHSPYTTSYIPLKAYYANLFLNDELYDKQKELPIIKAVNKDRYDEWSFEGIPEALSKEKEGIANPDYYIAQYDGAIRAVDDEIGRILKNLIKLKLDKKTIIIITSDHGEMFGEHNYYFLHGWFLYEPLIKVPLIIKCDNIISRNRVIDTPVSAHLDITPTILDILKIDKVKKIEGVSLLGIILGKKKYPCPYIFSDEGHTVKCIRNNEWKLIYNARDDKGYSLYNLKNDPGELNNLASLEKEIFGSLKYKLDEYKHANLQKPILEENAKIRLKSLGYIQ